MHPLDFYDISFQPIIQKRIQDVFAGDVSSGIEVIITTRTGHKFHCSAIRFAINYEGKKCLLEWVSISAPANRRKKDPDLQRSLPDPVQGHKRRRMGLESRDQRGLVERKLL